MDCKNLTEVINSLPGIEITNDNLSYDFNIIKSNWAGIYIFFNSDEKEREGLFFLVRSMDCRYWEFGHLWRIELSSGDKFKPNGDLPINYNIFRPITEELPYREDEIEREIESLIGSLNYHFHNNSFMNGYNMDRSKYTLKEWQRQNKLNNLGI